MLIPAVHQIHMASPVPEAGNQGCSAHSDFLGNASVTLDRVLEIVLNIGILLIGVTTSKMNSEALQVVYFARSLHTTVRERARILLRVSLGLSKVWGVTPAMKPFEMIQPRQVPFSNRSTFLIPAAFRALERLLKEIGSSVLVIMACEISAALVAKITNDAYEAAVVWNIGPLALLPRSVLILIPS